MYSFQIRKAQVSDAIQLSELICENARHMFQPHYNKAQWDIFIKYYSVEDIRDKIVQQVVFCA